LFGPAQSADPVGAFICPVHVTRGFASEIDPDVGFALCEAGTTKTSTAKTAASKVLNIASRTFELNEADLRVGKVLYMVALLKLVTTVFIEDTGFAL
jgi:hypothetical protein